MGNQSFICKDIFLTKCIKISHLINPFMPGDLLYKCRLEVWYLKITLELITNSQNIWRRVVRWVLINLFPSNIFSKFPLLERYHLNSQVVLGPIGMNGLRWGHQTICILSAHKIWQLHTLHNKLSILRKIFEGIVETIWNNNLQSEKFQKLICHEHV